MALPELENKLLVLSPHLDDAVLSCANLIAQHPGSVVATVFAGIPAHFESLTAWDAASGFASAHQAVSLRRQEDSSALALLSATPRWLDFFDSQYKLTPSMAVLTDVLARLMDDIEPTTVLLPAGLFHSDHVLVHQAMLSVREQHRDKTWLMYEEAHYRRIRGLLQQRLAELHRAGIDATPFIVSEKDTASLKREAVRCYASQLRALQSTVGDGYADAFSPERHWTLDTAARANAEQQNP
jgi:LmbE family N-acetylglucosaminyl deacetylase